MTKVCTVPGCTNKHLAKGFCQKHYRQKYRKGEEPTPDDKPGDESGTPEIPKYTPPEEIMIGKEGPNAIPKEGVQDPAKERRPPVQYAIGTLQIEMCWEVLNKWAPNSAVKLELSPLQRQALDSAFIQAGLTTTNPWVIIVSIVAFPTIVFILLNYDQIKLGAASMLDDFKNAVMPKKKITDAVKALV